MRIMAYFRGGPLDKRMAECEIDDRAQLGYVAVLQHDGAMLRYRVLGGAALEVFRNRASDKSIRDMHVAVGLDYVPEGE